MSLIVELSIFPLDKGPSLSAHVARVVGLIRESGLAHEVGPMGTSIEGELEEVMGLILNCIKELEKDCDRIYWTIKGDLRKGREAGLKGKLESLKAKL